VEGERGVTGANFMATSVSTVMDKTRIGLNHFGMIFFGLVFVFFFLISHFRSSSTGKMAFAQFGQLTNPSMSRGLPVDCAAFEPSLDMGLKIADIAMAAYYSGKLFILSS
jgi:phenylalanine ammonia-lyase